MSFKDELTQKFEERRGTVGIIGLGYVGLPLAVAIAEAGFNIIGVDIASEVVFGLNNGISHVEDIPDVRIAPLVATNQFWATTDYNELQKADAIIICVPTPLRKTKDPDVSFIIAAVEEIARIGVQGKLVVLESTTYPGTTEEIVLPEFQSKEIMAGSDFFLAFSPERIDPGRTDYVFANTPKVIGGVTPDCLDVAISLYETFVDQPVPVSNPATAEMVKLLENTFRAVNIGLVNEMALMCDKLGLNIWEVVEAAATKPYGFMKFTPGPGLGGHCIPVDPHYLSWKLRVLNYTARFVQLADEVNRSMPDYVVMKTADALNQLAKAVRGSHILILGVAYKPNIGDLRESPALEIIERLIEKGANVSYHDPYVPNFVHEDLDLTAVEDPYEAILNADCTVIVTDHDHYDWRRIGNSGAVIVDTRNALKGMPLRENIISI
ncbi:MAG: nucleotide sugar dehydrogenase [Ardenticatenaceae bacterium]|nr:nucleotide sugar dehydrogenase [Ardenticatenaceae bacterium]